MLIKYFGAGRWVSQDGKTISDLTTVDGVFSIPDAAKLDMAEYGFHRSIVLYQGDNPEAVKGEHPTYRFKLEKHRCFTEADVVEPTDTNLSNQSDKFNTTERTKMLKLIYGMAVEAYGYDPQSLKNAATGEKGDSICSRILTKPGIKIDNGTVKKYLDEAKTLIEKS